MSFQVAASRLGFVEGPILVDGATICVSLDFGHVYRVSNGDVDLMSAVGGSPNGAAIDGQGRLFIAQNGGHVPGRVRRSQPGGVQVVEPDGSTRWLTLDPVYPTDICFGPDGMLYVTDATRTPDYGDGRIWKCDPDSGRAWLLHSVPWFPNGIAFGLDNRLYVASTGNHSIYVSEWTAENVSYPEIFSELRRGAPDGLAFDAVGKLLVAAVGDANSAGSLHVIDDLGTTVDVISVGSSRYYTNLALSTDSDTMVVTDSSTGVLLVGTGYPFRALPLYPFRSM